MKKNTKKSPPRWADQFLEWFCKPGLLEDLQGDLHQRFEEHAHEKGYAYARFRFVLDVFSFLRPYVIRRKSNPDAGRSIHLLQHYFKIGFRNLYRDKKYLVINSAGLAVGAASALILIAYIFTELSFDRHFKRSSDIYRVSCSTLIDNTHTDFAPVPPAIGLAVKDIIPEIESMARFMYLNGNNVRIQYEDNVFHQPDIFLADSTIFDVFSFHFILGGKEALQGTDRIVIVASLARKIFGDDFTQKDILDKPITIENHSFFLGGVIQDIPNNSHVQPSGFIGWHGYGDDDTWNDSHAYTYIVLKANADPASVQAKLDQFTRENEKIRQVAEEFGAKVAIYMEPLSSIHLSTAKMYELSANGNINYVYALGFIAIFFLISSGINYTNIAIAASVHRAKEIGVRKTMGALRKQIQRQFLTESGVMIFFASLLAMVIFYLLIPYFNSLMQYQLSWQILLIPKFVVLVGGVLVLLAIISSFYPAFYLSVVSPILAFKNSAGKVERAGFRKVLLIIQFSISAIMIIAVVGVSRQMNFINDKSLGFNKENILLLPVAESHVREVPTLKEKLKGITGVFGVSACGYSPGLSSMIDEHRIERSNGEMKSATIARLFFDHDYLSLLGLKIIEGRNFERDRESDYKSAFLVNQAAVKAFGWDKSPRGAIGRKIEGFNYGKTGEVIGVVEDVNLFSLKHKIQPLIMNLSDYEGQLYVKIDGVHTAEIVDKINRAYKDLFQENPIGYHFLDERFNKMYEADKRMNKALLTGSQILIFISCLGLFGLSAFMVSLRTKEIGVRKVLGASIRSIVMLLSKDYVLLIMIANLIAVPIGYMVMNAWLETYAYHITVSWWLLLIPILITGMLALLSVSFQVVKASKTNPVDALRYE
jgi:putative ABC transport system permease protein